MIVSGDYFTAVRWLSIFFLSPNTDMDKRNNLSKLKSQQDHGSFHAQGIFKKISTLLFRVILFANENMLLAYWLFIRKKDDKDVIYLRPLSHNFMSINLRILGRIK